MTRLDRINIEDFTTRTEYPGRPGEEFINLNIEPLLREIVEGLNEVKGRVNRMSGDE